ncbi:SAG family member [Cyclospora cayetanensis]|uniref:SAG family member n=1 Tax=Cyclospora cayetanensis TaxID=88456 RepID=A0A1D3CS20_9EIME|nr:SAG family member [Cyclospora cayetanensis]
MLLQIESNTRPVIQAAYRIESTSKYLRCGVSGLCTVAVGEVTPAIRSGQNERTLMGYECSNTRANRVQFAGHGAIDRAGPAAAPSALHQRGRSPPAAAHGHFVAAVGHRTIVLQAASSGNNASELTDLTGGNEGKHCTEEINAWRKKVFPSAVDYEPLEEIPKSTKHLKEFLASTGCDALKRGSFNHITEESDTEGTDDMGRGNELEEEGQDERELILLSDESKAKLFVISAVKNEATREGTEITCKEAIEQWKTGFTVFKNKYPPEYKDNTDKYANGNAAALVSLLSKNEQKIYCGHPKGCPDENSVLVCYFKPSGIEEGSYPVTPQIWHQVEEYFKTKPTLKAHGQSNSQRRFKRGGTSVSVKEYEKVLYKLTCDDINNSTIDPAAADGYTVIFYSKEGEDAPTAEEAVKFWETGLEKLNSQFGNELPPAFTPKSASPESEDLETITDSGDDQETPGIYYDSAVAGYVSLMADGSRKMGCYNATGCTNSALICIIEDKTLVENENPISEETWEKILKIQGIRPTLQRRDADCLDEINNFRTQESLGLAPFVAVAQQKEEKTKESTVSDFLKTLTCQAIIDGNATVTDGENNKSILYHHGTEGTCSEAVTAWERGYEVFRDLELPPVYTSSEKIYKDGAATNFISLISEGTNTTVACYDATGCAESAVVCELSPSVFTEGTAPITKDTWAKLTPTVPPSGAAAISSASALLGGVLAVIAALAIQF